MTETHLEAVVAPTVARAPSRGALRRLLRNPLAVAAGVILLLVVLMSLLAPLIAPHDPSFAILELTNAPPGGEYLLGGDGSGRDILSRLIWSGRLTLLGVLITTTVSALLGVTFGLIAGYVGGWFDSASGWVANFLIVLPGTLVLVALFSVIGPRILLSMAVLGVLMAPNFYRVTRNQVVSVRKELYVDAARVAGLSNTRIIGRHIFSVVRGPLVILCATAAGIAMVVQAGLEFIGLGDPSTPTWGGMLLDAFTNLFIAPLAFLPPGLMIGLTVASLILIGNGIRDALNEGERGRRKREPRSVRRSARAQARPVPTSDGAALLEIRDLVVGYDQPDGSVVEVVHGVSLSVERGEVFGLVGESGSGKTQTVLSVLGLLPSGGRVVSGSIVLDGNDLLALDRSQMRRVLGRSIGYIPQEPMSNLDPAYTVGHQLTEPLRVVGGLSRKAARERALELLARVGITDPQRVFDSYPHQVSGGMAQRVLIAGAIACEPVLLVADEPTTALDVTVQAEVLDLLRDVQSEHGMAVLLVTHNFGVVADLCDSVTVMRDGLVVEAAPVGRIFDDPQHEYTRALLDSTLDDAPLRPAPRRVEPVASLQTNGGRS